MLKLLVNMVVKPVSMIVIGKLSDEEKEVAVKGLEMIVEAAARGAVNGAVNRK